MSEAKYIKRPSLLSFAIEHWYTENARYLRDCILELVTDIYPFSWNFNLLSLFLFFYLSNPLSVLKRFLHYLFL